MGYHTLPPLLFIADHAHLAPPPGGDADLGDADPASVSCLLKLFLVLQDTMKFACIRVCVCMYKYTNSHMYVCMFPCAQRELPEPLIPVDILQQVVAKGDSE